VDLRLGTWFAAMKARKISLLDIYDDDKEAANSTSRLTSTSDPARFTNKYYVPFGEKFILHPRAFILACTLEWIRLPLTAAGIVAGKSSWGRRGLIIETAPGIHPGFTGCLTLEITNLGDIPIAIEPGTAVCQLFLHQLENPVSETPPSRFLGQRQPQLSAIAPDDFARKLAGK
jgi:dCTP deaminase